jgi:hypothetical protein
MNKKRRGGEEEKEASRQAIPGLATGHQLIAHRFIGGCLGEKRSQSGRDG